MLRILAVVVGVTASLFAATANAQAQAQLLSESRETATSLSPGQIRGAVTIKRPLE